MRSIKKLNFGQRMRLLKEAKAKLKEKIEADKKLILNQAPKEKSNGLEGVPDKRIEVTSNVYTSKMEENTSTHRALELALDRIEKQARGL